MNFSAELYTDVKEPKYSQNEKIAYWCGGIVCLLFLGMFSGFIPHNGFFLLIFCTVLFIPLIIELRGIFSEEELNKEHIGNAEFTLDKLMWNKEEILWSNIDDISTTYFDYKGKFLTNSSIKNNLSAGLDNKIFILTKEGKEYSANILLKSEEQADFFGKLLMEIVKANRFSYKNAKQIINPGTYAAHQELKKYSIL